ncbi:hypothetical protein F5Y19DRAFT_303393 [Xylariaceae sp. FL1651]|nr:hypothetical protein F5Y19DRAFT_303393 [Xylariaceae sp. FL1651]
MGSELQNVPAGDIGNHVLPEVIIIVTGVVAFLAVVIRILARHIMRRLGIADILLVISLVFYALHHYNAYQAAIYPGLGVHQWQFNAQLAAASKYNFKLGSVYFGINIAFLKIAILLDWVRTFVPTGQRNALFWMLHALIWSNAIFYFIGTFIEAFQCPPEDVGTPRCNIDVAKYNLASGIINVISDLTILIAPHWVIWKLNMSKVRKIGVSLLFLIGILAIGSAIARVIYVSNAYKTSDILFYSVTINLWAIAEQTFGYLVIGVPAIPKVFQDFPFAKHFGSLARSKRPTDPSDYHDRDTTWPNSTPRGYQDPWEMGDTDTHVLVTIVGGEDKDIPLVDAAHTQGKDDSRKSSADAVGVALTSL